MIVDLYIENDRLDLFGEENIQITSAVADISDITKNLTDYSRNFTVPASDINNRIFKHYYNANIDNTFDARTKSNARIYLDGVLFKEGKLQLNKVEVKKGRPSSYGLNFFGNLLNLSTRLGDDKLSDLDLTAFDHPYTSVNVKTGLESGLFGGDLVYSLFLKKQALYDSDPTNTTKTETLENIAYQGGANINGVEYNTLKPSLKNIRIIEAIESKYNLNFSRDFFGRSEFADTFLWLNNTSQRVGGGGTVRVDFDGGDFTFVDPVTDVGSFFSGSISGVGLVDYTIFIDITPDAGFENVPYTILYYLNDELIAEYPDIGFASIRNRLRYKGFDFTYEVYFEIRTEDQFSFTSSFIQAQDLVIGGSNVVLAITTGSTQTIGSSSKFEENAPDIKIIDYLKGFFQMFKLVVIPTGENELYVNTIQDYYKQGESFDITRFVDAENYTVERGELLNEIDFSFEEPSGILNVEFEKQNNQFYGNEESTIRVDPNDPNSEIIDGKKEEYKVPFEVIVYDRLIDQNDEQTTNVMYAPVIDEEFKPINPKPHIHYNINIDASANSIGLIDENNNKLEVATINTPFHCEKILDPSFALLFSQELNEWDGSTMLNTLYSNYHAQYISGIFNIKRRNYKYSAYLPFNILTKISLDDILKIKNDFFRIDKYTLNLTTGKTDLELITAFDVNINRVVADRTNILVDFNAQTTSVFVTNLNNPTLTKVDLGNGTGWLTLSINSGSVFFAFDANPSPFQRVMQVDLVQGIFTINFFVTQTGTGIVTADVTTVTVDNTIITADNG